MKTNPTPPIAVQGFLWMGRNIGIKDQSLDFGVLAAVRPCSAAAVFTQSNLPGAPVIVGREHAAKGTLQAIESTVRPNQGRIRSIPLVLTNKAWAEP